MVTITAGEKIKAGDLVIIGEDGRAYRHPSLPPLTEWEQHRIEQQVSKPRIIRGLSANKARRRRAKWHRGGDHHGH